MNRIEYREYPIDFNSEESDSRIVEGYGSVFERQSEDMGFIETIHKGAITDETIIRSDVIATLNHDMSKVFARSKYGSGSLELKVDDNGLHYRFECPHTMNGDELLEFLKRGDITASSFAFTVSDEQGSQEWRKENGVTYRDIYKIDQLFDVSPVFCPAYPDADCQHRNKPSDYDSYIQEIEKREKERIISDLNVKKKDIDETIKNICDVINEV